MSEALADFTGATVTTLLLYDGQDLVEERLATGGVVSRTVHGPGVDEPLFQVLGEVSPGVLEAATARRWFVADHLGSVVALTDATRTPVETHSYSPFGVPADPDGSRFRYTGQLWPALDRVGRRAFSTTRPEPTTRTWAASCKPSRLVSRIRPTSTPMPATTR